MADNAALIHDVDCEYDSGKFILTNLPEPMPDVFTVRFTTPETFTQGDTIVAAGRELILRTPANINASTAFFRANTVFHCDIDLTKNRAFTWSNINASTGTGTGGINLSLEEQDTGRKDWEGKTIYQKTCVKNSTVAAPDGDFIYHGIDKIQKLMDVKGFGYIPGTRTYQAVTIGVVDWLAVHFVGRRGYTVHVTLEYTKE